MNQIRLVVILIIFSSIGKLANCQIRYKIEGYEKVDTSIYDIAELHTINDRYPNVYKYGSFVLKGFNSLKWHLNLSDQVDIEVISLKSTIPSQKKIGIKTKSELEFKILLDKNGDILKCDKFFHRDSVLSKELTDSILKCKWKPALMNLKPVKSTFILNFALKSKT
jgi:hypothetical protein